MSLPLVVANWKMNTSLADASVLSTLIRNNLRNISGVQVVLCPPNIWLQEVASVLEISGETVSLGAQNCYPEASGAYTGEISVTMIKDLCRYCIVGHSERRHYFKETNEFISEKVRALLANDLIPILCVGEAHRADNSVDLVIAQLKGSLDDVEKEDYGKIIVAYEPIWAIGTADSAESDYADRVGQRIKQIMGAEATVLYGGSVTAENIEHFTGLDGIDGVLVGGASLKASEFVKICEKMVGGK